MIEQQMSEGLQILSKFFALKTESPENNSSPEVHHLTPNLPQPKTAMPLIQIPPEKVYEPIGRGRGPKILLGSIFAVGLGLLLIKVYKVENPVNMTTFIRCKLTTPFDRAKISVIRCKLTTPFHLF